jgi:hypothetical protein
MKHLRLVLLLLALVGALTLGSSFYYVLPKTEKVHISGTEIKRAEGSAQVHDVRYVQAVSLDGTPVVFRNEDTRWGWPPYLKFNSADISAQATELARDQPSATVLVTYYGARDRVLDWYPNAVKLAIVPADYQHIPIFNIAFFVVLFSGLAAVYVWTRRRVRGLRDRWKARHQAPQG